MWGRVQFRTANGAGSIGRCEPKTRFSSAANKRLRIKKIWLHKVVNFKLSNYYGHLVVTVWNMPIVSTTVLTQCILEDKSWPKHYTHEQESVSCSKSLLRERVVYVMGFNKSQHIPQEQDLGAGLTQGLTVCITLDPDLHSSHTNIHFAKNTKFYIFHSWVDFRNLLALTQHSSCSNCNLRTLRTPKFSFTSSVLIFILEFELNIYNILLLFVRRCVSNDWIGRQQSCTPKCSCMNANCKFNIF